MTFCSIIIGRRVGTARGPRQPRPPDAPTPRISEGSFSCRRGASGQIRQPKAVTMPATTRQFAPDLHVYDTTLRDGAQQEGLTLSVEDKLAIAGHLDDLGVGYIEGGWPGAIPK